MSYTPKDNSGSLFKNDKREKDTHPNAKGTALIGGVEYWVSAWTKQRDNGEKWQSLSFTPKEQQRTHGEMKRDETLNGRQQAEVYRTQPKSRTGFDDMDDDTPY
jgi:hypothetical protein